MTMTAPAAPAPSAPATPAAAPPTAYGRAAALKAKLDAEPGPSEGSEPEGEGEEPAAAGSEPPSSETRVREAAPTDDAAAKARQERLARIEQVRAKELADDAERQQKRQRKERDTELEKLRTRIAELEPQSAVFQSEEALLAEAERRGMSAEKLVQWMRTRLTDPAAVAQRQTQTLEEKFQAELAKERAAREALEKKLADQQESARAQHEGQQRAMGFVQMTQAKAADYPLTAGLLKRHGPVGLINFANEFVAPRLREQYTLDELHDNLEQLLDDIQVASGAQQAPRAPETPVNGTSHPAKKNGAAEPSVTLSNALTSERVSVAEEIPLSRLPRKERTKRLREKLERE